jgi:hypothetical protein
MRKIRRPVLPAIAAVGFLLGAWQIACGTARAYCRTTSEKPPPGALCSSEGKPFFWDRQCVSFSMSKRSTPEPSLDSLRDAADRAFRPWTEVECANGRVGLQIVQTAELGQCTTAQYNLHGPNANTIMFLTDWAGPDFYADAFAITQIRYNSITGEIYDADMQINETLGPLGICDGTCPPGVIDLQNTMTHEAGHFLGLGHSDVGNATMSAQANIGETTKRDLASDDNAGLCAIYGANPPAKCESKDFLPRHGFSPLCAPPDAGGSGKSGCSVVNLGARDGLDDRSHSALTLGMIALGGLRARRRRNRC